MLKGAAVSADDVVSHKTTGEYHWWDGGDQQLWVVHRDGSEHEISVQTGTAPDFGGGKGVKLSISAIKRALKEVHKQVGKLPKGRQGKFGSSQRGNPVKGYRLDKVGHPKSSNPNEQGAHINWWDFTKGKWNKGRGPGRKGAEPIK